MAHLSLSVQIDDLIIAANLFRFEFDSSEVGRQTVVIVLCNRLKRMIVAFGTLDAHTEKQLRRCLGSVRWRSRDSVEVGRWSMKRISLTGQRRSSELVEWHVVAKHFDEIAVKAVYATPADRDVAASHHIGPFQCPKPSEFFTLQQLVDKACPLVWFR